MKGAAGIVPAAFFL